MTCDKTGGFQKRWNMCNYSHTWQGFDINSCFILCSIHWLRTVEIVNAYFLLAFKHLFSVNRIMSYSSKFLPFTTAITASVYKWWTVLVTHHETVPFPNVAEPLFTNIKVGHTIQPTTHVNVNRLALWHGCVAHLFCICSVIFPAEYLSHSSCWPNFVCWQLVSGDGAHTDAGSVAGSLEAAPPLERTGGIGESRPPSYQSVPAGNTV